FRSVPVRITEDDGLPLAVFGDRRTPDLEFDRVVFASGRTPVTTEAVGLTDAAAASGRVWALGIPVGEGDDAVTPVAASVITELGRVFPEFTPPTERVAAGGVDGHGDGFEAVV